VDEDCDGTDARPVAAEKLPTPSERARGFHWKGNVLLITIDALRADRMRPDLMPRVSKLASESVLFTNARAQAPNTPRSFPSVITSRYPSQVKWIQPLNNYPNLSPDNVTLFEQTAKAGLHGIGIFSHFYFTPTRGISRGMAEWSNEGALTIHDSNFDSAAPRIVPRVIKRLDKAAAGKERFLLWTHLFEPHSSYMEHPGIPTRPSGYGPQALESKYDGECAFVDRYVGEILDALGKDGLAKDTVVVVFADHGESFNEHRKFFHGETVYDEVQRVPFIIHVPGLAPRKIDDSVMLMDLAPTILDLVKAEIPKSFRGVSLLGTMLGDALPKDRRVFGEMMPCHELMLDHRFLVEGEWKLYYKVTDNVFELYHLTQDPTEQHNLWDREREKGADLRRKLLEWMRGELRHS
jgi:arylsulfatase A-like enzyme